MSQSPQRENIKPGVKFTLIKCSQVKDSPDFIITQKKTQEENTNESRIKQRKCYLLRGLVNGNI